MRTMIANEFKKYLINNEHLNDDFTINTDGLYHLITSANKQIIYCVYIETDNTWNVYYQTADDLIEWMSSFDRTDIRNLLSETEHTYLEKISKEYRLSLSKLVEIAIDTKYGNNTSHEEGTTL